MGNSTQQSNFVVADDWTRNWEASVAIKITSAALWVLVFGSFIHAIVAIHSIDQDLVKNFNREADTAGYRLSLVLHSLPTDAEIKPQQLMDILQDLSFTRAEFTSRGKNTSVDFKTTQAFEIIERLIPNDSTNNSKFTLKLFHIPFNVQVKSKKIQTLAVLIIVLTIYGLFHAWIIGRILAKPFACIEEATRQVNSGDFDVRLDTKRQDEFGRIALFFNTMLDGIVKSKQELADTNQELKHYGIRLESMVKERTAELEIKTAELETYNQVLTETLKNLEQSNQQLILSEKMASLGELVAGIAHELNTPAGAIKSAIDEIDHKYDTLLKELVNTVSSLPTATQKQYVVLCHHVLKSAKDLSTKEQRTRARGIRKILEEHNVDNTLTLSKNIALIGLTDTDVRTNIDLFAIDTIGEIISSLRQLGMAQLHVRDIKLAIGRITQLVKALKSYSHLDEGEITTSNLHDDLDNTLVILHNKIKRSIKVHKQYESLPPITGYIDQLNQVWTNLIHNAIQAMRGEGDLFIRVYAIANEQIAVEIEDTGCGIPKESLDDVFIPHYTTKKKGEGTGLGLAISKDIIDKHNGHIEIESQPGKTCFRVIVPVSIETKQGNS